MFIPQSKGLTKCHFGISRKTQVLYLLAVVSNIPSQHPTLMLISGLTRGGWTVKQYHTYSSQQEFFIIGGKADECSSIRQPYKYKAIDCLLHTGKHRSHEPASPPAPPSIHRQSFCFLLTYIVKHKA